MAGSGEPLRHTVYGTVEMQSDAPEVFYCEGQTTFYSKGELDMKGRTEPFGISFSVRSIGEVPSLFYFLLDCYTQDHEQIKHHEGQGVMSASMQITLVKDNFFHLTVEDEALVVKAPKEPQSGGAALLMERFKSLQTDKNAVLAFYFDGFEDRLPDYTITSVCQGKVGQSTPLAVGQIYTMESDGFQLAPEIVVPSSVLEAMNSGKCTVRIHYQGGYTYPFGIQTAPKDSWRSYNVMMNPVGKFTDGKSLRMGTRYVKLGFLANYHQPDLDTRLLIKDLKVYRLI